MGFVTYYPLPLERGITHLGWFRWVCWVDGLPMGWVIWLLERVIWESWLAATISLRHLHDEGFIWRYIGVSHTACKDELSTKIFDLTAGVYFNFYNI